MQKNPPSSLYAGAAIAAALAFGSTAALAQDAAADVPTVAPPAPSAAAAPPAAAPATMTATIQAPVVQAVPAAPAAEAAPAARSQPRPAPAPRQAAARPAARAVAPPATPPAPPPATPEVAAPAAVAPAPVANVAPLPEPAPAPVAATTLPDEGLSGAEAGLLGLLAAAGLGGAALLVGRSRRRRPIDEDRIDAVPAVVAAPQRPPEPAAASPERFAMPAGPVPAGTEREALLKRMVAAPPDAANPFVSRKRRVQRASVLLAERELRDRSTEPFDWRTYRSEDSKTADRTDAELARVPYPT